MNIFEESPMPHRKLRRSILLQDHLLKYCRLSLCSPHFLLLPGKAAWKWSHSEGLYLLILLPFPSPPTGCSSETPSAPNSIHGVDTVPRSGGGRRRLWIQITGQMASETTETCCPCTVQVREEHGPREGDNGKWQMTSYFCIYLTHLI